MFEIYFALHWTVTFTTSQVDQCFKDKTMKTKWRWVLKIYLALHFPAYTSILVYSHYNNKFKLQGWFKGCLFIPFLCYHSFFFNRFFCLCDWPCPKACGILVPQSEVKPMLPALEVLTTGPPGKSLHAILRGPFNLAPLCIALYLSSFHSSSVEFITLYYSCNSLKTRITSFPFRVPSV